MKIHKGDTVQIISGNDRGKQGKILAVFPQTRRIIVEGAAMHAKHVRPKTRGTKGEVIRLPSLFPASRALLVCGSCGKAARVGYRLDSGKKMRVCKKCGKELE